MEMINKLNSMALSNFYKSICATIDGIATEIVLAEHSDKFLIFITQYQKLGSFLTVAKDQIESLDNLSDPVYSIKLLSGPDNIEQQVAVRFIAEQLNVSKKLCIFICLKSYDKETVKAISDSIINLKNNLI